MSKNIKMKKPSRRPNMIKRTSKPVDAKAKHGWNYIEFQSGGNIRKKYYPGERIAEYVTKEDDWFNKIINPKFLIHEGVISRKGKLFMQIGKVFQTTSKKTVTKSNLVFELGEGDEFILNGLRIKVKNIALSGGTEFEFTK
jgi:hypothetical protein